MKATKILFLGTALFFGAPAAQAQFGIINSIKKAKKMTEDVVKEANGDTEFTMSGKTLGFFRARTRQIIFHRKHEEGDRKGKMIIYTIEENGDVIFDDGRKVGEIKENGDINCRGVAPYLTAKPDGDVVMDGDKIGHIDNNGNVFLFDTWIGTAAGMTPRQAAYLYFGVLQNKESLAAIKTELAEAARKQAEEAGKRAAEEEQRRKEPAAQPATASQIHSAGSQSNSRSKVREYRIEKGSARGYIDENGVVYNQARNKIGKLPKGNGDITDKNGQRIGSIWSGDIKDRSGNLLCHVTSGGSISVKGSNATVAEVRGAGRVDTTQGSKTLGYCQCNNNTWTAAIIFCDLFRF